MCVILSCKTKHPTLEMLERAHAANPHGAGVAWLEGGLVRWRKGLDAVGVAHLIADGVLKFPYVVHFRLASVGEHSPELCHPFPITDGAATDLEGDATSVLFHNGTWRDYESHLLRMRLHGQISDTRVLAAWISQNEKPTDEGWFADLMLDRLSETSRFVLFDRRGPILYGRWWRIDQIDLSNTIFMKH